MKIIKSISDFREQRRELQGSIGFVPTMGALHTGHAALIERSVRECDLTVISIYVNATQFDNASDLEKYPDTLDGDLKLAEELGVDFVFMPDYQQMYPDEFRYQLHETEFSKQLCGAHRDGHFTGVLTVVMKLLNIVRPNYSYFGEKDFQQYRLIRGMVEAFFMDVEIVGCETVRESDGLALSSRNLNLDKESRELAPKLHEALVKDVPDVEVAGQLDTLGFDVDYIQTLEGRRYAAASLGSVRLIDNVPVDEVR